MTSVPGAGEAHDGTRRLLAYVAGAIGLVAVLVTIMFMGMRRYLRSPQTSEAGNSVAQMTKDVQTHFEETHTLCPSATSPVPRSIAQVTGRTYQSEAKDWFVDAPRDAGFACLKFEVSMPQHYQYSYESDGRSFTITAKGDLDGDGIFAVFTQTGRVVDGQLVLDPRITPFMNQ